MTKLSLFSLLPPNYSIFTSHFSSTPSHNKSFHSHQIHKFANKKDDSAAKENCEMNDSIQFSFLIM